MSSETATATPTPHAIAAGWIIGVIAGLMFAAAIFGLWQLFETPGSGLDAAVSAQPE